MAEVTERAIYRLGLDDKEFQDAAKRTHAASALLADDFSRIEARIDPLAAAQRKLAREVLAVARAEESAEGTAERRAAALTRATANFDRQSALLNRATAGNRAFGASIQQAGFQVGDFAVQIASGTNPMRAFIQQGTQLISMFGPWGAVIGAAGAVVGALATSIWDFGDASKNAAEEQDKLNDAIREMSDLTDQLNGKMERTRASLLADQRGRISLAELELKRLELQQQSLGGEFETSTDPFGNTYVSRTPGFQEMQARIDAQKKFLFELRVAAGEFADLDGRSRMGIKGGTPFDYSAELKKTETATEAAAKAAARYAAEVMKINDAWMKSQESQADAAQKLVDRLDPVAAATRKLEEDQGLLLVAMANGIEITGGYEAAMRGLEESYRDQIDPIGAFIRKTEELQKLSDAKTFAEGFERDFKAIEQFGDQAFDRIGSAITEAFATGQLDLVKLGDIGKAVMSELIQFAIQLSVINPFKNWLTGGDAGLPTFGSIFKSIGLNSAIDDMILANPDIFAKGAAFRGGNVIPFARGGLVTAPTIFPMANGMGLMGEAGPEAVMPLQRTTDGRLGVASTGGGDSGIERVIINNYTGERASQEVRPAGNGKKDLVITIGKAGADDIRSGGALARSLEQTYNLKRSGGGRG